MIPTEDNYAEWFTCAIRFFFLREGYAFLSFSLGQVRETGFPVDKLLAAGNRIVGLQFASPVEAAAAGDRLEYAAEPGQHQRMADAADTWLYYALPQSVDPLDQQLTHQKVVFAEPTQVEFTASDRLVPKETRSFKQLVECIEGGTCGRELTAGYSAERFLEEARENSVTMYMCVNGGGRAVFALKAI